LEAVVRELPNVGAFTCISVLGQFPGACTLRDRRFCEIACVPARPEGASPARARAELVTRIAKRALTERVTIASNRSDPHGRNLMRKATLYALAGAVAAA
jgi:hypothetical protein